MNIRCECQQAGDEVGCPLHSGRYDFPLMRKWMPKLLVKTINVDWKFDTKTDKSVWRYVEAADLEAELARATIIQSHGANISAWHTTWPERHDGFSGNSHEALLLSLQPLAKPSRKREIAETEVRKTIENELEAAYGGWNRECVASIIDRLFGQGSEK